MVLAERQARVGRKLLATGNGRCNLTNENARPGRYHGEDPDFCRFALEEPELSAAGTRWTFSGNWGLLTVSGARRPGVPPEQRGRHRCWTCCGSPWSSTENIRVRTGCVIRQLKRPGRAVPGPDRGGDVITAGRCILAAGGAAGAKLGGGMDGYPAGPASWATTGRCCIPPWCRCAPTPPIPGASRA
ncbi:MAG: hypothetical protein ACLUNQ_05685 [Oscillospiraceae bacterium]